MKRIGLITVFWITYTSLLCAQGNGTYHDFNLEVDGLNRQYKLYVPEGHDGSEAWPLVFNFHWGNGIADNQIKISQMYLVADTAKFLIVYPQGLEIYYRPSEEEFNGWNIPDNSIGTQDDVLFVNKIIDDIISNSSFNIDLRRIHATGLCGGGMFSHYLAFKLPNRIASVASVVGPMSDTLINYICNPVRKISVLHMQGTNDPVLLESKEWFLPLKGSTDFWSNVNGCNAIPDSTQLEDIDLTDSSTVTLFDYNDCDQETEVKLYRINGGGHTWPGGWIDPDWIPIVGVVNKDINASSEIWNFFKRNPHPNPWVEIPDTAFLHALIDEGVDTNEDSIILYEEAEEITYLDVCFKGISDMKGIEAFFNLDTLKCNANQFTSLDVSTCTALKYLYCPRPFPPDILELLTSLNISGCTALKLLDIGGNELTSLDVSNNTELGYLNLSDMPTLYEVCVWESFPAGVDVHITDSPNVCFQTDCNGDCSIEPSDVTEEFRHSGISLYPNPTCDIINIEIENPDNTTIEIYDVSGTLVFSKALDSKIEKIDISGLPKGIYIVKVIQDRAVNTEKVVVR